MAFVSLAKPVPLSSEELRNIASTMYGRDLSGWQSRLARDLTAQSDRTVLQTQISQWTGENAKRCPPWWLGVPAHLALVCAAKELSIRADNCRELAEIIKFAKLSEIPAGLIRPPTRKTEINNED